MLLRKFSFHFLLLVILGTSLKSQTQLGIDELIKKDFELIKNMRIALFTNHSGRNSKGLSTLELLSQSKSVKLKKVFVPEHGFYTTIPAGKKVSNDTIMGIPIVSLYGAEKRPSKKTLDSLEAIVIDIQDVGVRSYTFISTIYEVMDACSEYGVKVIILDRPNPLGGFIVDGPTVEDNYKSFVSRIPVSYIHGCTVGELALMINGENWLPANRKCDLQVVKMNSWERWMSWEDTGLEWFPTSPHIPSVDAIRGMAALGITGELGIISIGIGSTSPFQYFGAPDFDTDEFIQTLKDIEPETLINSDGFSYEGIQFIKAKFSPFYGMYKGKTCDGFLLRFPLSNEFRPFKTSMTLLYALNLMKPELFSDENLSKRSINMFKKVTGTADLWNQIQLNNNKAIDFNNGIEDYINLRSKYLLY